MFLLIHAPLTYLTLTSSRAYSNGPKFEIEGVLYSKEEIQAIAPEQRTVKQWLHLVDWDLARMRPYVILDPFDPSGLLYLNSAEYLVQARTLASNNVPFVVVSRPGTVKPVPAKNPPEFLAPVLDAIETLEFSSASKRPEKGGKESEVSGSGEFMPPFSRSTWRDFNDLRKWISKNAPWGEGETVDLHHGNVMGLLVLWCREILHYLDLKSPGVRIGQLSPLIQHLQTLLRHNGQAYTIARLKISLFCLYSYVGGNPVSETSGLGQRVRLRNGLPTFLGLGPRSSIREGNLGSIRLWASLFNIYKVMKGPHGPSPLETIEAPEFKGDVGDFASFNQGINSFWERWQSVAPKSLPEWKYKSAHGYVITSAGANSSCAMSSLYWDALAWENRINLPLEWYNLWKDRQMHNLIRLTAMEGKVWNKAVQELDGDPCHVIPWRFIGQPNEGLDSRIWPLIRRVMVIDEDGDYDAIWRPSLAQKESLRLLQLETLHTKALDIHSRVCRFHKRKGYITPIPLEMITDYSVLKSWISDNKVPLSMELQALERVILKTDSVRNQPQIHLEDWIQKFRTVGLHPTKFSHSTPLTGRLHSIPEPAGKVRVVAIGDYFSQVALKPLHEYIFDLLRTNPNDATFDQQKFVDQFAAKGYKEIFSYDLKSATDLIPAQLYKEVLEPLIGRKGSDLWLQLMKDREWLAPKDLRKAAKNPDLKVKYSRGQPMGLLSSWASLALVHHSLVQFAAMRAGWDEWFPHYLVLGDDITIADEKVAEAYLNVCEEFGIKVGLAKSLISRKGLMNFASQTLLGNKNISPISLGEELVALNWDRRKELAKRIVHRYDGEDIKVNSFLRRVLTANQWAALQGELTGSRKGNLSRLVEFVLRNPFLSEEFHIDRVIEWLGLLDPRLTSVDSFRTELVAELTAALLKFIKQELEVKKGALKVILGGLARLGGGGPNNDWELPHLWNYLQSALLARFEKIGREFDAINLKILRMHPDIVPDLGAVIEFWKQVQALLPIPADSLKDEPRWFLFSMLKSYDLALASRTTVRVGKLGAIQGRFPAPKAPRESLRVPSQALFEVIAKVFGEKLPVYEIVHRRPSNTIFATIMASIREVKSNRLTRDVSSMMNTRALVVPQVVMPMVPLLPLTVDEGGD